MKEKLIYVNMGSWDFVSEIYGYDKEHFLLYDSIYKRFLWIPFVKCKLYE